MDDKLLRDALMLWATIDPIGTVSLFLAVTARATPAERRSIAVRSSVYAAVVLMSFVVVGQIVLDAMEIPMASFQIAGGIILFLFGLQMVFQGGDGAAARTDPGHDVAVFPLAIPSIASPGAIMAVVLLTDNDQFSVGTQAATAGVMLAVVAVACLFMLAAGPIHRLIGNNGAAILIRVMGMVLAALAVEEVVQGIRGTIG